MNNALVVCHGYLGDHLFASSLAQKLIEENQFDSIDYLVGFPQVIPLLQLNPYITNVLFDGNVTPSPTTNTTEYKKVIRLRPLSFVEPPCIEFQKIAGVHNPTPNFTVYTDSNIDYSIKKEFAEIGNLPIVAIMSNWAPKTYRFTKEQYAAGIDVPNKGYGGSWRDISYIVERIKENFATIEVGAPENISQFETATRLPLSTRSLLEEASILKHCSFFVGAEGGLANLAAGVGCKTILTSDFVHQLYGWNGVLKKIQEPKLGPRYYFDTNHIDLDPYLSDEEVANQIINIINRSYYEQPI